jgi:hypothetical protein
MMLWFIVILIILVGWDINSRIRKLELQLEAISNAIADLRR